MLPPCFPPPPERILTQHTYRFGADTWQVVTARVDEFEGLDQIRISRNGKWVLAMTDLRSFRAVFLPWPYPGRLLAVSADTRAGHGVRTHLYRADRKGLTNLKLVIPTEAGGPIFRDLDHDGRPELIFDNYNWYDHLDHPSPTAFTAYRYNGKTLQNFEPSPTQCTADYRIASDNRSTGCVPRVDLREAPSPHPCPSPPEKRGVLIPPSFLDCGGLPPLSSASLRAEPGQN